MNPALAATGALAVALSLAGCGSSPRAQVQPDLAGTPTWGDCSTFSESAMSIAEGAHGAKTAAAVLADYREGGDHVVSGPSAGGLAHRWLVDANGQIHADLEVWHSHTGWFVTGVKRCAG